MVGSRYLKNIRPVFKRGKIDHLPPDDRLSIQGGDNAFGRQAAGDPFADGIFNRKVNGYFLEVALRLLPPQ